MKEVEKLLALHHNITESRDSINGYTSLHWAAQHGHEAVAAALLAHGADPQPTEPERAQTPLHLAAAAGRLAAVRALVDARAPLDALDADQRAPLHLAIRAQHLDVAAHLARAGASIDLRDRSVSPFATAGLCFFFFLFFLLFFYWIFFRLRCAAVHLY